MLGWTPITEPLYKGRILVEWFFNLIKLAAHDMDVGFRPTPQVSILMLALTVPACGTR